MKKIYKYILIMILSLFLGFLMSNSSYAIDNLLNSSNEIKLDMNCSKKTPSEKKFNGFNCTKGFWSRNQRVFAYSAYAYNTSGTYYWSYYPYVTSFYFDMDSFWGNGCKVNNKVICELIETNLWSGRTDYIPNPTGKDSHDGKKIGGVKGTNYDDASSYFWCVDSPSFGYNGNGRAVLTGVKNYTITFLYEKGGYNYYEVVFYAKNSNAQEVKGKFRRPNTNTLTLVAINEDGGSTLEEPMDSKTVDYNGSAEVLAKDIPGYTFLGIRENSCNSRESCGYDSINWNSRIWSFTADPLKVDKKVYAVYRLNTYQAKIEVTDNKVSNNNNNKTSTLGWTDNNDSMTKYIRCDNSSCSVTYKHFLKQKEGINGTTVFNTYYKKKDMSNYELLGNNKNAEYDGVNKNWKISPGSEGKMVRDSSIGLSPGDTYSEELIFERSKKDGNRTLTAIVIAPYNFINTTSITNADEDNIVYAGETKEITASFEVNEKYNSLVGDTYATIVPETQRILQIRYNNESTYISTEPRIKENTNVGSNSDNKESFTINIQDLPAGSTMKVRSCVSPKDSGSDDNTNPNSFNKDWSCSNEKTFIIAKKPSFQVWGSGLYSAGKINVPIAKKTNIADDKDHPYSMQNNNGIISFGSWVELGLIVDNTVEGLASGAGMGYNATSDAENPSNTPNNLGGGSESFCKISTLTIPNVGCSNNKIGSSKSNSANASNASSDKSALISRFANDGAGYEKIELDGDTVDGMTIIKSETKVIDAGDKTITITDNIVYQDDSNDKYTSLAEIPKLIIYANNIKIACNVTRIDAVLIANYDINTCVDDNGNTPDLNSKQRSNQLIINGSVITDTIHLNRTYGAATGNNSIIPAEIINYDSSLYLWTSKENKTTNTGKLTQAYSRELAPRY